jgi:hypothetical protein
MRVAATASTSPTILTAGLKFASNQQLEICQSSCSFGAILWFDWRREHSSVLVGAPESEAAAPPSPNRLGGHAVDCSGGLA